MLHAAVCVIMVSHVRWLRWMSSRARQLLISRQPGVAMQAALETLVAFTGWHV